MDKIQLKSFIHGSMVSMIGVGTLGIMNYLIRRTLLLNLSQTDYGFFYSAYALVMVIILSLDLGLVQSTTILLSKSFAQKKLEQAGKIFTLTLMIKASLAVLLLLLLEALVPYFIRYYFKYSGNPVFLMLIFLLIPGLIFEAILNAIINAKKAFATQQILANLRILIILTGVLFFIKTYGILSCILCFLVASIIVIALAFKIIWGYGLKFLPLKKLNINDFKNLFSLSSWIAISAAGISIMYYMDTVCLTFISNLKSVAMYNIALPIMQIAQSLFVFPLIFTPFVSEMWQKKDYRGIRHSCYIANSLMLLSLPFFIFTGIYFGADIISLLFDKKYIAAAPTVTILWAGMVFLSIASFNLNALNSGNKQKHAAFLVLFCVLTNLVINLILIPKFNYNGAALATSISYFIMALGSLSNLNILTRPKLK